MKPSDEREQEDAAEPAVPHIPTADELRRQYKATREGADPNWAIRMHRAVSWLKQAEKAAEYSEEAEFLFLWIALNSMYGCWSREKGFPKADSTTRPGFIEEVFTWSPECFRAFADQNREHIRLLYKSKYLTTAFWGASDAEAAAEVARSDAEKLDWDLGTGKIGRVLRTLTERIYVLRSQIVHGASTSGSYLNRKVVETALYLLRQLVPLCIGVAATRGREKKWPELCYPPKLE